jgi:hypothetical protein
MLPTRINRTRARIVPNNEWGAGDFRKQVSGEGEGRGC